MKPRWILLRDKFDAMSVRERVMTFFATAAAIVFIVHSMVLTPLFARESLLKAQITQQRKQIAAIDGEIVAMVQSHAVDPDAPARARLAVLKNDMLTLSNGMRAMQTGLVAPEQMAPLLERILRSNGRLRLIGLTTLPASSVTDDLDSSAAAPAAAIPVAVAATLATAYPAPAAESAAAPAPATQPQVSERPPLLYRHGVELAVRGNYLDMVSYLDALEAMPAQLIWSKATLAVEDYPSARLTLRVYTLSLDKKWMKL